MISEAEYDRTHPTTHEELLAWAIKQTEEQIKFLQRKPTIMRRSTVDRVRREQVEREGKK